MRFGIVAPDDAAHLLQLCHQVRLDVQAARRVDDDDVRLFRLRGGDRVVDDGGGVAALLMPDDANFGAVCPDGELICRCRAEGIRRGDGDALLFLYEIIGELADGGRFADAVDADEHDDGGILYFGHFRLAEGILYHVFEQVDDVLSVFELFFLCLLADLSDDVFRRDDGDVCGDEDLFELIVEIVAQPLCKQGGQFGGDVVFRLFECADDLAENAHTCFLFSLRR